MRIFANLSLGKLCGKGSKTNKNHIETSNAGSIDDLTQSDRKHVSDPTQSDREHAVNPTQTDRKHSDEMTQSFEKISDDPTQSDRKHSDDPTPSEKEHSIDPTQSDKEYTDDQTRNRMSAPRKIQLEVIESVTNSFADAHFIGEGFLGKIYGGQVLVSGKLVDVAVRRLDNSFRLQELAFEKEISILSRLEHPNIVSIVGYCYENDEMLIVSERVARGSLRWHLSDYNLTWMRRLQISIGVVSALSYLHNGAGHNISVIHHNINCDSILLDENWKAKISGFEYSMTIPAGGLDLAYEKLGIGTNKSDVFSIGVVLFELLCGREAFVSEDNNTFQASAAIFHYKNGKLHECVDQDLYSQMDQLSFYIFSKIAYDCLINERAPPTMDEVLKRLGRALKVQERHENNDPSTVAVERRLPPDHLKLKLESLEHMRIPLTDIVLATVNFSKGCIVSSGGYGSVYIAELDHVDKAYCLAIERDNVSEVPKKRNTVAIKRIMDTEDEIAKEGFYAEIEILTSCKHSNIITLLGFCDEGGELILIYEYASNKSLSDYIQITSNNHNNSWAQRVKICLDVAKGLSCLHNTEGERQEIVHRDIKSANILLHDNFEAKIGDFGLSVFLSVSKDTRYSRTAAGTPGYVDPQYWEYAKLKKELDVYSFGVVLFEVLFGTVAYDTKYNSVGLALLARHHFNMGTIKEMVDSKIKEEIIKTLFTSVKGPNQESFVTFSKIAYECLEEEQSKRPTMKVVVKELKKALFLQETRKDILQVSLKDIVSATNNFSNKIGEESLWIAYRGEVSRANGHTTCFDVKCMDSRFGIDHDAFSAELNILTQHKHENVISLLGYCEEGEERFIVYEQALNKTLDQHMNDVSLTWDKRLKICIDIASALDFLHGGVVTGEVVIHRDIKSRNIVLDADMNAKIANFGLSVTHPVDQKTAGPHIIAGTLTYLDPEYKRTGVLSKECDIYSFGIVLFEILLRRTSFSFDLMKEGRHLGPVIKDLYKKGKLDEMMFEGTNELIAPQSLTIFKRIAIQCLRDKREERPTAGEVMIQLKQALEIQEKGMDIVRISFDDIKHATDDFNNEKYIGGGGFGWVYKGQLSQQAHGHKIIAAKRFYGRPGEGDPAFYRELEVLFKFKHNNVIGLVGYCDEMDERIIVYEYASKGSLDELLENISLTWKKRLDICINVASGLEFLHGGVLRKESVIHRDVKSGNILLSEDWEAKITDFGLSLISPNNQEIDYVIEKYIAGTESYIDPAYIKSGRLSKASDIYTFGVVLFEILSGKLAYSSLVDHDNNQQPLVPLAKNYYEQNKLEELVFEGIKEQIVPQSLCAFANIAYQCIHDNPDQRPTASQLVVQLKEAKTFQEDCEMWEPKLPSDYREIIQRSQTSEICDTKMKKDLYEMLCEGILIQKGKVWFWLDSDNNRNEMISATLFTYESQSSQKWRRLRRSRFERVPLLMDISDLKIQIQIKAQFLTPSVPYGVYLVFKFGEPRKKSSERMYVNLKYKRGNESLHAYFSTWRDSEWMMIELYRFFSHKDDGRFEVLLESFSRYYCRSSAIYVEGIEFRAIDNMTYDKIVKLKDVQQSMRSNLNLDQMKQFPPDNDKGEKVKHEESDESQHLPEMTRVPSFSGIAYNLSDNDVKHEDNDELQDLRKMTRLISFSDTPYSLSDDDAGAKVKHADIDELQDAQQLSRSPSLSDLQHYNQISDDDEKDLQLSNRKKLHMLSVKEILYDSSNVKLLKLRPTAQSRFEEVIELLSQQVFRMKCNVEKQKLSEDTDYQCYLIFELSKKCHGLHCPVKVRDVLRRTNKETEDIYFRFPNEWNIHNINQVPKQRADGWMEVNVWKFNSKEQLKNDYINLSLKLISYEGTMSGLIVCGLEFRPMYA